MITLGMASFLAAKWAGPITAFIIVMEFVLSQAMVLSLMASALFADGVGRIVVRPMQWALARLIPRADEKPKGTLDAVLARVRHQSLEAR